MVPFVAIVSSFRKYIQAMYFEKAYFSYFFFIGGTVFQLLCFLLMEMKPPIVSVAEPVLFGRSRCKGPATAPP